jgi:cytidylate kinase
MKKVIAIDGPSGAGKSTIAKLLAGKLGFAYLDTGALYRAIALYLKRYGLREDASDDRIAVALERARVEFRRGRVFLNDEDVSEEIRSPQAGHYASVFSAKKPVRDYLLGTQRQAAETSDLVAEGRDMTTVVFPGAYRKVYLDASVEERVRRRTLELISKGFEVDEALIRREIVERDARDTGRNIAPLQRAADALFVDSSGLTVEEVFGKILDVMGEKDKESIT